MPVVGEFFQAERISGEESVMAGVPVSRVTQVLGVVKDGDADFLPRYIPVKVHPVRTLAPDGFLAHRTFRVHHAARRRIERVHHTDRKGPFLGIADLHRTLIGTDGKLAIDDPRSLVAPESVTLGLGGDHLPFRGQEIEFSPQDPRVRAAAHFVELAEHGAAKGRPGMTAPTWK